METCGIFFSPESQYLTVPPDFSSGMVFEHTVEESRTDSAQETSSTNPELNTVPGIISLADIMAEEDYLHLESSDDEEDKKVDEKTKDEEVELKAVKYKKKTNPKI